VVTEFFRKLCSFIDSINTWVGRVVTWATAVVVVVVFVDVVMRYLFNSSYVFTQELEWHLFAFIFLMGAGATLLKDGHVRVDIFYQRLSHRGRAWINLVGVIFFLIPGCLMIVITSLKFTVSSFAILEGSPDPGGIPFRFIIKSCIPAGISLVLIQGIALGIRSFYIVMGKDLDAEGGA
jgi:TRAP-type mannitol/chloroaromatic compound transport system permease small subunit